MRRTGSVVTAFVLATTATTTGALVGASPAAAAETTTTITRQGHTLLLHRFSVTRTAVTGTGSHRADFDGDGRDDVAVPARASRPSTPGPVEKVVIVTYSSFAADDAIAGAACFGEALVAGDLDDDGFDDLVVGDPCDTDGGASGAGGVWVLPGSSSGLSAARARYLSQDTPGVPGASENGDAFGQSLATGDLTGDGRDDLVVAAPGETIGTTLAAGAVTVLRGSATGLTTTGAQLVHQGLPWVPGAAEQGDRFGDALAIGRVDRGANADLAVGASGEDFGVGLVALFRGAAGGVATTGVSGVLGTSANRVATAANDVPTFLDAFGSTVAVADTTGDGLAEVVVGVPRTRVVLPTGELTQTGSVVVLGARATGLTTTGMRYVDQDTPGVPGVREQGDAFGGSLAVGDVTGDDRADVLVGAPFESVGRPGAGAVVLLRGAAAGVSGSGAQQWTLAQAPIPGTTTQAAEFGWGVALLNLDGRGTLDAAVTTQWVSLTAAPSNVHAGSVSTFTGGPTGLTPRSAWTGARFRTADFFVEQYGGPIVARKSQESPL